MSSGRFRFIFYNIRPGFPITGPSFWYYFGTTNQLKSLIHRYKQYRTILVCKGEDIQELNDIIKEKYIHEMFILGDYPRLNINNKEITMINTNERDFIFRILHAAVRYTHDEEMTERKSGNCGVADVLSRDILKLLEQIEAVL